MLFYDDRVRCVCVCTCMQVAPSACVCVRKSGEEVHARAHARLPAHCVCMHVFVCVCVCVCVNLYRLLITIVVITAQRLQEAKGAGPPDRHASSAILGVCTTDSSSLVFSDYSCFLFFFFYCLTLVIYFSSVQYRIGLALIHHLFFVVDRFM